jgi:hypothetical protein
VSDEDVTQATHQYMAQIWDATVDYVIVDNHSNPLPRWDEISPQSQLAFLTYVTEHWMLAPIVDLQGRIVRADRRMRN